MTVTADDARTAYHRTTGPDEVPPLEGLLDRVRELVPLVAEHSAAAEADRRVPAEVDKALLEAGAFRLAQPKKFGGYETSVRTMLEVSSLVAEGDGGTAWVVTLCNVCAFMVGMFPEEVQAKVWGDNPNARVSGVLSPTAEVVKVDGGYRVTGKWFYNSGSFHADWAVLGIPVVDEDGTPVDQGLALVSREDLDLQETWFVAGMSSSGSNCLIAEDVFVPESHVVSTSKAIEGTLPGQAEPGLYRAAFVPVLTLVLAGPQLGLGRRALEMVTAKAGSKAISYTFYSRQSDSVGFQLQVAKASLKIDTAHLHAYRAADDIDAASREQDYQPELRRARARADSGWAVEHITSAIDDLLYAGGAGSFAQVSPLQRVWRDSATAARHAVVLPIINYEVYGKELLGRDDQITPLV